MLEELVFQIEKHRVKKNQTNKVSDTELNISHSTYSNHSDYIYWRDAELEQEYSKYFDLEFIKNKTVLDFGCGTGSLSLFLNRLGAKSIIGVDLIENDIVIARNRLTNEKIDFMLAKNSNSIELENNSIDVIACFDVMEHIIEYKSIIKEWYRVLRPGGKILISWQPYYHPYGHHEQVYLKVPWVHVFLSQSTRRRLCSRIVNLTEFDTPHWDKDEEGNKINRFNDISGDNNFLNKLTMRKFEIITQQTGFQIEKRNLVPLSGPRFAELASETLSKLPLICEYFTANAIYILRK